MFDVLKDLVVFIIIQVNWAFFDDSNGYIELLFFSFFIF